LGSHKKIALKNKGRSENEEIIIAVNAIYAIAQRSLKKNSKKGRSMQHPSCNCMYM